MSFDRMIALLLMCLMVLAQKEWKLFSPACRDLVVGQDSEVEAVGRLCFDVNSDHEIEARFTTHGDWTLEHANVWMGTQLDSMPLNNAGIPLLNMFPFQWQPRSSQFSLFVPLSMIDVQTECDREYQVHVACHIGVKRIIDGTTVQTEGAWSEGIQMAPGTKNNARFTTFELSC